MTHRPYFGPSMHPTKFPPPTSQLNEAIEKLTRNESRAPESREIPNHHTPANSNPPSSPIRKQSYIQLLTLQQSPPTMETRSLLRPLSTLSLSTSSPTATTTSSPLLARRVAAAAAVTLTPRRHQSSTARTKRALKVAPHGSFLTPATESNHIIYNPPAAAPSVYHTPFKFLPRSDPRRQANLTQLLHRASPSPSSSTSSSSSQHQQNLPPPVPTPPGTQRYNVTREQVEEMRALREDDPARWSVLKLAERYACSPIFVMMCCRASAEHRGQERERLEAIKARWGPIRSGAREERRKRKALLLKGGL
ncbi:mitochondrial ribosomal protein subunit L20-domain-containing protein [Xylariaceae sp. FL0662B]|nr:mitochondrial ribosomal protein subunit L20-domain-containing protein [Xylariaceae sp. FL0662B]